MSHLTDGPDLAPPCGDGSDWKPTVIRENMKQRPALLLQQPRSGCSIVQEERKWCSPDILSGTSRPDARLIATRWRGADMREQSAEISRDHHMLSVSLQSAKLSFWIGKRSLPNLEVTPGTIHLARPAVPARAVYHSSYDVLHLFMQNALLKECFKWCHGKLPIGDITFRDPGLPRDPLIERLGRALLSAGELGESYDELYAESLGLTIAVRLLKLYGERPASTARNHVAALPNWRLRRAVDFMNAYYDRRLTLIDLAKAAGLSRMYFAAQFRVATGLRPHQYLLRLRVEKAKALLATSDLPIVDVALSVGFSSQAHFTGVFKTLSGLTPRRWRQHNRR
ncbi:helix-turn-helix transcriptional regulator [Bradyrhizobium sp. BRP22]|uniref:AraC family transcriptional regulator n=1 Tax=Bradyrhizobium sp. BRP22 TaxID=2793821 RepID=UPI001CD3F5C6|nr:AraC family transcriptional regulator [Bradyrhizobium sp. BRP22]MCA1452603.1 helix-turn-helix transcriptional regulator [Bradyrhizobium sp. BRP22]